MTPCGSVRSIGCGVLLMGKFVILHELLVQQKFDLWMVLFVPFLTRVGMSFYFMSLHCSKEKGLAYF